MKYCIVVITRHSPYDAGECLTETVRCTSKKDLEEKYMALIARRAPDILSIRVEHSEHDRKA